MTHNHIWQTIARLLDAPAPDFVYIPRAAGGSRRSRPEWCVENFRHKRFFDATKAQRDLGFQIPVRFEEGSGVDLSTCRHTI